MHAALIGAVLGLSVSCQPAQRPPAGPQPPPPAAAAPAPLPLPGRDRLTEFRDVHPVVAAAEGFGEIWLGTDGGGVLRFDPPGGPPRARFGAEQGLPSPRIRALAVLGPGDLAIGTSAGLVRLQEGKVTAPASGLPAGEGVTALALAADGTLWLGWANGLVKLSPGEAAEPEAALTGLAVTTLHFDSAGDLWVGTKEQGLLHVAGSFAEQFSPYHGLATAGIVSLVTTRGGGVMAIGPLEEGGELLSLYDGVQWYPLKLEQPDAVWQVRDLAVVRAELLLLTGFGVRRVRQVVIPPDDPAARARAEKYIASSLPQVTLQDVPPPPRDLLLGKEAATEVQPSVHLLAPEEELPPLVQVPPPEDLQQAEQLQKAFEVAREARSAYHRARARQLALQAELGELETRRKAALERELALERRLAAAKAGASSGGEELDVVEKDLAAARTSARQSGVAFELTRSKLSEVEREVGPARAEALRLFQAYDAATGGMASASSPAAAGAGEGSSKAAVAQAQQAPVQGTLSLRPAPYVERSLATRPRLVLEPVSLEQPSLAPGEITLWQSGERGSDVLWIGSIHDGAWRWTPEGSVHLAAGDLVPVGQQQGPLVDLAGNVWVIGATGKLVRYDGARWSIEELPAQPAAGGKAAAGAASCVPRALTLDEQGRLALACVASGKLRLLLRRGEAWQEGGVFPILPGQADLWLQAWAIDGEGRHWLGIAQRVRNEELHPFGLVVLRPGSPPEMVYHGVLERRAPAGARIGSPLPAEHVSRILVDRDRVWVGTASGLCRFEGETVQVFDENDGMTSESVKDVAVLPGGELWVATAEGCGKLSEDGRWTFYRRGRDGQGLPSNQVHGLALDPGGTLWAATERGLARWNAGRWEELSLSPRLEARAVRRITFEDQGRAWLLLADRLVLVQSAAAGQVRASSPGQGGQVRP